MTTRINLIDGTILNFGNDGWAIYSANGAKSRDLTPKENMLVQAAYRPQFVADIAQRRLDQQRERMRYLEGQVQRDGIALSSLRVSLDAKNVQIEKLMAEVHRLRLRAEQRMASNLLKSACCAAVGILGFAWLRGAF